MNSQTKLDLRTQPTAPALLMTEQDEHEVRCGICAREVSVDDEIYRFGSDAMDSGQDNPFRCEVCSEEYDYLEYQG
jgi:hypothetical protein